MSRGHDELITWPMGPRVRLGLIRYLLGIHAMGGNCLTDTRSVCLLYRAPIGFPSRLPLWCDPLVARGRRLKPREAKSRGEERWAIFAHCTSSLDEPY
jgi:hypothetical protein